jgi:hypothetical protein
MKLSKFSISINQFVFCLAMCAMISTGCENAPPVKVVDSNRESADAEVAKHDDHDHDHPHDEVAEAMAKLSPEDRQLAEAQGYCVVGDSKLGGMGVPVKLMIEDKPVFICCEHCKEKAEKDATATLAKLEEMKKKTAAEKMAKTEEAPKSSEPAKEEMKKEEPAPEAKKEEPKTEEAKPEMKKEEAKPEEPKKEETK